MYYNHSVQGGDKKGKEFHIRVQTVILFIFLNSTPLVLRERVVSIKKRWKLLVSKEVMTYEKNDSLH